MAFSFSDGAASDLFGGGGFSPFPLVKHRIFVSYHHAGDQPYYDAFSKIFHENYETIYDNSLERVFDSDNMEYVLRKIRENHIHGTSCTIALVGPYTWGRKFVDWEIDATLQMNHALVGVQLPTLLPGANGYVTVPDRLNDNIHSGFAVWTNWNHITSGVHHLNGAIALAKAQPLSLMRNGRARRQRNASIWI
jgi:hypothetical protein